MRSRHRPGATGVTRAEARIACLLLMVARRALGLSGRLVLETRRYDNTRWAEGEHPRATMPDAMGQLAEASSLAVLGGLGP